MQILDQHIVKTAYDHCKRDLKFYAWMWGIIFFLTAGLSLLLCLLLIKIEGEVVLKIFLGLLLLLAGTYAVNSFPLCINSFRDYGSKELVVQLTKVAKKTEHTPKRITIYRVYMEQPLYREDSIIVPARQYNNLKTGDKVQVLWGAYSKTMIKLLYKEDIISG